jgi:hypothetical protein
MKLPKNTNFRLLGGLALLSLVFVSRSQVFAEIGVGIDAKSGEIRWEEPIKQNTSIELPIVTIYNTGDENTDYEMKMSYHSDYPDELKPKEEWFSFSPKNFSLAPDEGRGVKVSLKIPKDAQIGNYFALLESGPIVENGGGTKVGVAVASKLFFSVIEGDSPLDNITSASRSFWEKYKIYIGMGVVIGSCLGYILYKKYHSDK